MNHTYKLPQKLTELLSDTQHGSIDIAQQFLNFLQGEIERGVSPEKLIEYTETLQQAFPWMAILEHIRWSFLNCSSREALAGMIQEMRHHLTDGVRLQVTHALEHIHDGMHIAFYSNSASFRALIQACQDNDIRQLSISIAEALPHMEGRSLYQELQKTTSYRVRLWYDPAFFSILAHVDILFVSCDAIIHSWVANKVGTFPAVRLANCWQTRAFLFALPAKILPRERAGEWIERILALRTQPKDGYIFTMTELDLTPIEYFDQVITPNGSVLPYEFIGGGDE